MNTAKKEQLYNEVSQEIYATIEGEENVIAKMATITCLLKQSFPYYYWCGFYIVDSNKTKELVIGPYQGTLGCLRIPFGKGVCGDVANSGKTKIVVDVHKIENHIACDAKSSSEIVVPVFDKTQNLLAVLDVDSTEIGSFDEIDQKWLELITNKAFT